MASADQVYVRYCKQKISCRSENGQCANCKRDGLFFRKCLLDWDLRNVLHSNSPVLLKGEHCLTPIGLSTADLSPLDFFQFSS